MDISDEAIKYCKIHIIKSCSGCKLKPLCKDYNVNYNDENKRQEVVKIINKFKLTT